MIPLTTAKPVIQTHSSYMPSGRNTEDSHQDGITLSDDAKVTINGAKSFGVMLREGEVVRGIVKGDVDATPPVLTEQPADKDIPEPAMDIAVMPIAENDENAATDAALRTDSVQNETVPQRISTADVERPKKAIEGDVGRPPADDGITPKRHEASGRAFEASSRNEDPALPRELERRAAERQKIDEDASIAFSKIDPAATLRDLPEGSTQPMRADILGSSGSSTILPSTGSLATGSGPRSQGIPASAASDKTSPSISDAGFRGQGAGRQNRVEEISGHGANLELRSGTDKPTLPNTSALAHGATNQLALPIEPQLSDRPLSVLGIVSTDRTLSAAPVASQPVQTQQVAFQIGEVILKQPSGPVEIVLQPEELGRLRIFVSQTDVGLRLVLSAERFETIDAMRRNIDQLAEDLRRLGYGDASFEFGGQFSRGAEQHERLAARIIESSGDTGHEVNAVGDEATNLTTTAREQKGRLVENGLDMRF